MFGNAGKSVVLLVANSMCGDPSFWRARLKNLLIWAYWGQVLVFAVDCVDRMLPFFGWEWMGMLGFELFNKFYLGPYKKWDKILWIIVWFVKPWLLLVYMTSLWVVSREAIWSLLFLSFSTPVFLKKVWYVHTVLPLIEYVYQELFCMLTWKNSSTVFCSLHVLHNHHQSCTVLPSCIVWEKVLG
jgi:hypothetical protein